MKFFKNYQAPLEEKNQNNSYFRAWREREVNKVPTQRNSDKIP